MRTVVNGFDDTMDVFNEIFSTELDKFTKIYYKTLKLWNSILNPLLTLALLISKFV